MTNHVRPPRFAWALPPLVLLLCLDIVACAVDSAASRLFQQRTGLKDSGQTRFVQALALAQTMNGVVVTLQQAYADANQIIVGYTITSLNGQRYYPRTQMLSDASGSVFSPSLGSGNLRRSDIVGISLPLESGSYVFSFDAALIRGMPSELNLRLIIDLQAPALPPAVTSSQQILEEPLVKSLDLNGSALPRFKGLYVGPFTFDFSVPFVPGRVVQVQQVVAESGVSMRLDQVVITPSETRATLCFDPPGKERKDWAPIADLYTSDVHALSARIVRQLDKGVESCHQITYPPIMVNQSGTWTLIVTEVVGFDIVQRGEQRRLSGPWVFRFGVP